MKFVNRESYLEKKKESEFWMLDPGYLMLVKEKNLSFRRSMSNVPKL